MTTFTPGLHFDIPADIYRAADGVNVSALKEVAISPKHYLQAITAPPKPPTPAQIIGTLTHSAVLENDHSGYVIQPDDYDGRTKEGKAWKAAQTKFPISREDADNLQGMILAIKNHPMASQIIYGEGGKNEVSCFKKHTWTELLLKGRCDRLTMDGDEKVVVVDLKTTERGQGKKEKFAWEIEKWKYGQQAAFYQDLFEASFFVFCVVEKESPYAVSCYALDKESIQIGRDLNDKYLAKVRECRETGKWPAYSDGLETIALSDWAKKKAQEL